MPATWSRNAPSARCAAYGQSPTVDTYASATRLNVCWAQRSTISAAHSSSLAQWRVTSPTSTSAPRATSLRRVSANPCR